jgi:hypothetical protein
LLAGYSISGSVGLLCIQCDLGEERGREMARSCGSGRYGVAFRGWTLVEAIAAA